MTHTRDWTLRQVLYLCAAAVLMLILTAAMIVTWSCEPPPAPATATAKLGIHIGGRRCSIYVTTQPPTKHYACVDSQLLYPTVREQ
jgi:hypothetical protein